MHTLLIRLLKMKHDFGVGPIMPLFRGDKSANRDHSYTISVRGWVGAEIKDCLRTENAECVKQMH